MAIDALTMFSLAVFVIALGVGGFGILILTIGDKTEWDLGYVWLAIASFILLAILAWKVIWL